MIWLVVAALLINVLAPIGPGRAVASVVPSQEAQTPHTESYTEWIVKWDKGVPVREFTDSSVIRYFDPDLGVTVASPREGTDPAEWAARWSTHEEVRYFQPNRRVTIDARPNDELLRFQTYLGTIQAEKAWDTVNENRAITIALVDTGVDLDHPDLRNNLVQGYNLIDEKKPPEDDHGHGTSVAGVIAAVGNNRIGISGLLWSARIMPIKALEADGSGSEDRLGRGIKYAVDHGAKIVVLSLGLYKYSNYLQEIVDYAERKGVLLVAASGNDGQAVKYPAAYPTVLAVGGVDTQKNIEPNSNRGPELDVVAPWRVYTTALGGGYNYNEGTSMAAPQAAAVAAMLLAQHPDWTPAQLRSHIRHTAEDLGQPGWDPETGYGLLRADLALSTPYRSDPFEPNDTRQQAKTYPIDRTLIAELGSAQDRDWYAVPAPYDGELTITVKTPSAADLDLLQAQYIVNGRPPQTFTDLRNPITVAVDRGTGYLEIRSKGDLRAPVKYELTTKFTIYRDGFEDNDRQYKAYTLPTSVQTLKGTFHQLNDQDWFV
jgi:subtilisin family serine protease